MATGHDAGRDAPDQRPAAAERENFAKGFDPTISRGDRSSSLPTSGRRSGDGPQGREAVRVALLSVGLALLLELLRIAAAAAMGTGYGLPQIIRDTLLKVPWAIVVCMALWIAIRFAADRPATVALIGLIAAPIASLFARSAAEMAHAMAAAAEPAAGPSPFVVAAFRGGEYACLGLVLMWLGRRAWSSALHHATAGFLVGLLFGGVLLGITAVVTANAFTTANVGAWVVNELLFPVGCALIVFVNARATAA